MRDGDDKAFLAWIRTLPSCLSGQFSEWPNGEPRNPACHVKRASNGGMARKPEFSAIPLTHAEHALQHQKGERALLLSVGWDVTVEEAKEWFGEQVERYRRLWQERIGE